MCRFHREVARDIALDPATQKVDPTLYAMAVTMLSRWSLASFDPRLAKVAGNNPYHFALAENRTALQSAGFFDDALEEVEAQRSRLIEDVRGHGQALIEQHCYDFRDLSANRLAKAAELDIRGGIYQASEAGAGLTLINKHHAADLESLRLAMAAWEQSHPGDLATLRQLLRHRIRAIALEANELTSPWLVAQANNRPWLQSLVMHPQLSWVTGASKCATGIGMGLGTHALSCGVVPLVTTSRKSARIL